jgi:hypothetical protein
MRIEYKKDGIIVEGVFLLLSDIVEKCNNVNLEENNLVLLQMEWDGRGGNVLERRILPISNAFRIKEILLDKEVYFGEIWGKHSEVYGDMCEKTFEIVEDGTEIKSFLKEYPGGIDFDHSFIYAFIEWSEEQEMQEGVTQEILDELQSLLSY